MRTFVLVLVLRTPRVLPPAYQKTCIFFADSTIEAVSSKSNYYGTASRSLLILVRKDGAFV